jgi:hypothetical protein
VSQHDDSYWERAERDLLYRDGEPRALIDMHDWEIELALTIRTRRSRYAAAAERPPQGSPSQAP